MFTEKGYSVLPPANLSLLTPLPCAMYIILGGPDAGLYRHNEFLNVMPEVSYSSSPFPLALMLQHIDEATRIAGDLVPVIDKIEKIQDPERVAQALETSTTINNIKNPHKKAFYAVLFGRSKRSCVYLSWADAARELENAKFTRQRSYPKLGQAFAWLVRHGHEGPIPAAIDPAIDNRNISIKFKSPSPSRMDSSQCRDQAGPAGSEAQPINISSSEYKGEDFTGKGKMPAQARTTAKTSTPATVTNPRKSKKAPAPAKLAPMSASFVARPLPVPSEGKRGTGSSASVSAQPVKHAAASNDTGSQSRTSASVGQVMWGVQVNTPDNEAVVSSIRDTSGEIIGTATVCRTLAQVVSFGVVVDSVLDAWGYTLDTIERIHDGYLSCNNEAEFIFCMSQYNMPPKEAIWFYRNIELDRDVENSVQRWRVQA
ncbi:hypothetical protein K474DRAFT_1704990 [Panus rudis PR-1116 ss-1]|nr:hypothetical protein K474DRAFT_1704990 [Panus rudis PR-1116 ss-1]